MRGNHKTTEIAVGLKKNIGSNISGGEIILAKDYITKHECNDEYYYNITSDRLSRDSDSEMNNSLFREKIYRGIEKGEPFSEKLICSLQAGARLRE